jgi:hypothetical protein
VVGLVLILTPNGGYRDDEQDGCGVSNSSRSKLSGGGGAEEVLLVVALLSVLSWFNLLPNEANLDLWNRKVVTFLGMAKL